MYLRIFLLTVSIISVLLNSCDKKEVSESIISKESKNSVYKLITDSIAVPDTVISIDSTNYLAIITNAGDSEAGVYLVNISSAHFGKLIGGIPSGITFNIQKDGKTWVYLLVGSLVHGIYNKQYYAFVLQNNNPDEPVNISTLFCSEEDGESGGCGEKERAKDIGLQYYTSVDECRLVDIDADGFTDISMEVLKENCATKETVRETLDYIFTDGKFIQRIDTANKFPDTHFSFTLIDSLINIVNNAPDSSITTDDGSIKYDISDFIDDDIIKNTKTIARRFTEISECTGDSIFEVLYSNNIVGTEPLVAKWFYLNGSSATPKGIICGSTKAEVINKYGKPYKSNNNSFTYLCGYANVSSTDDTNELVTMVFKGDILMIIMVTIPFDC